jgi:hypothetical protein
MRVCLPYTCKTNYAMFFTGSSILNSEEPRLVRVTSYPPTIIYPNHPANKPWEARHQCPFSPSLRRPEYFNR